MHEMDRSDPVAGQSSQVQEVYDRLTTMHADVLLSLMVHDQHVAQILKQAYATDPLARKVFDNPAAHEQRYQIIEGILY